MSSQKFVLVNSVHQPTDTGVDNEVEIRAIVQVISNGAMLNFQAPFKISKSMPASQREAAMVKSINDELLNYGITITDADLAWPWFR